MNEILAALGQYRPVFHNCDGVRRALARIIRLLFQEAAIHTEINSDLFSRRIDIYYERSGTSVGILLRYPTRRLWTYWDDELYNLPGNSSRAEAQKYLEDIRSLEQFVYGRRAVGYAIILTNDHLLWTNPLPLESTDPSIHHGSTFPGPMPEGMQSLSSAYSFHWQTYSQLDGENGWFRYCVTSVC